MNSNCPVHAGYFQPIPCNYPFTNHFCQCFGPPERGCWGDTEDPVYIRSQPNLPAPPSSPIHSTVTPYATKKGSLWQCTICLESFPRRQERNGHLLTHVPYFMHCPLPHCPWRGNRADLFKKHWEQENHRGYHEYYGRSPKGHQIETYDPWAILNQIINGTISVREGEDLAIFWIQVKAYELQKTNVWRDPWGR